MDPRDAHNPEPVEEVFVVVTGKVRDKGASKVLHVECQAGWVDPSGKLQALRKAEFEDQGREVGNEEDTVCLRNRKPHVPNRVYTTGYPICNQSGQPVHEQSGKRALGHRQVDFPVLESRDWQGFGLGLAGLALSKPNRISLNRLGVFKLEPNQTGLGENNNITIYHEYSNSYHNFITIYIELHNFITIKSLKRLSRFGEAQAKLSRAELKPLRQAQA